MKNSLPLLAIVLMVIVGLVIIGSCGNWERKDPMAVTYRENVNGTDSTEIWRNVKYELVTISYDTVPKGRVDLNDYLGSPDDDTDWNYTEIDDEEMKYLEKIGIYWDSNKEYWRKH